MAFYKPKPGKCSEEPFTILIARYVLDTCEYSMYLVLHKSLSLGHKKSLSSCPSIHSSLSLPSLNCPPLKWEFGNFLNSTLSYDFYQIVVSVWSQKYGFWLKVSTRETKHFELTYSCIGDNQLGVHFLGMPVEIQCGVHWYGIFDVISPPMLLILLMNWRTCSRIKFMLDL